MASWTSASNDPIIANAVFSNIYSLSKMYENTILNPMLKPSANVHVVPACKDFIIVLGVFQVV